MINAQVVVPTPTSVTNTESSSSTTPQITLTPPSDAEDNDSNESTENNSTVINHHPDRQVRRASVRNAPRQRPPPLSGQRWGPSGPAGQYRKRQNSLSNRPNNGNPRNNNQYSQQAAGSIANHTGEGWNIIQRHRKPRDIRRGSGSVHGLQGAPPPISRVFVYRVQHGSVQSMNSFLQSNNIDVIENEKVSHDDATYSSFKVTLSIFDRNKVLRYRFWPRGIQCKLWHDPRPNDNLDSDD